MTTMYSVDIDQAYNIAVDYMQAGITPFLTSSPGLGKSATARKIAKDFNLKLIDIRLSQVTSADLMGLPMRNDQGRFFFAPSTMFPYEGDPIPAGYDGWLLFFDEFNSAAKSVQAAAYQPVLDHAVGQMKLHENCMVMAAGNLSTDRAIVTQQGTAMQSRLGHITIEHSDLKFMAHMIRANFDVRVRGFIDFLPQYGHNFDPDHSDRTFSCPRTLEFLSDYVKNKKSEDVSIAAVAGLISDGVGSEFVTYIKEYQNLPRYGDILKNPKSERVPNEPATCFAVISMLIDKFEKSDITFVGDYVDRLSPEFQIPFYRGIKVRNPGIEKDPKYKARIAHLTRFLTDSELDAVA